MSWPEVTVLIVTYDRPQEIRRTIDALLERLRYPGDRLRWHLADDGSPQNYCPEIKRDYPKLRWSVSITERRGWGANVNKALNSIKGDYVYLNEDDYVAKRDIDLRSAVALMEAVPSVGLVRLDGIEAHSGLVLKLREAKDTQAGRMDYLVINRAASAHLNVYSHRPHLKHVARFHGRVGLYPEKLDLGRTESVFAHRVLDAPECPEIAVLADGIPRAFDHIGKSRQGSEHDKPR